VAGFVLGINNGRDGETADWVVKLRIDGTTATVSISRWLIKDNVLVHGEHHDAVRNELLRALALGQSAEPARRLEIARMNQWSASDSSFTPVIAAVPPGTQWSGFGNVLIAAGSRSGAAFHTLQH
jgi:hypothetical protein